MTDPANRQTVSGIGGGVFKTRDPGTLAAWYRDHTDPEGHRFELWQPPPGGI